MFEDIMMFISEVSGFDIDEINREDYLEEDLGFDSIMMMDLYQTIMKSELQVNIENISKDRLREDIKVQDFIKLLLGEDANDTEKVTVLEEVVRFNEYYNSKSNDVPYFKENQGIAKNNISISGKEYINYSTYNYLGLNGNKDVINFVLESVKKFGTSVSGSRLLSGEIPLHRELESELSSFIGTEDCLVQVGGHSTNINMITSIVGAEDLIIHDSLAHNSIIQGALFSGAQRKSFKHNDMDNLDKQLSRLQDKFRRILIVVEGVYSMDGDICNLPKLLQIKKKYGALLMIDEAHSFGTIGKNGRGVTSYFNINPNDIDILMGTLSKSASSCGGYIAGKKELINYLRYNMGGFIFSCGITPANSAAALESIRQMKKENLIEKLSDNSKYFLNEMKKLSVNTGLSEDTPIIPWIVGESDKSLLISKKLFERGINVMPIIYPAVKEEESRLRFFMSNLHTKSDMDQTLNSIREVIQEVRNK